MTTVDKTLTEAERLAADVLTTGVEGGINYWARGFAWERLEDLTWLSYTFVDTEGGHVWAVWRWALTEFTPLLFHLNK